MKLRLATAVSAFLVLQAGAAGAGTAKGRKAGVRRLSEFRSGRVVIGQIVDVAPGFGRVPGRGPLGRDQHGRAMELDDSTPGQLRFRNRGADGLRVTDVHTWDGAARRWIRVKNGKVDQEPGRQVGETRPAAFIQPTVVLASGKVNRIDEGGNLGSVRLRTYYGRSSGTIHLTIDAYAPSGRALNYHLELPLDAINDALAMGVEIETMGWTISPGTDALEIARTGRNAAVIRLDRKAIDQVWAGAERDFPLAD